MRKLKTLAASAVLLMSAVPVFASEAELVIPDLSSVLFMGITGHNLLLAGLVICVLGVLFGLVQSMQISKLPVHKSMLEISELIYETCKTYLVTQGKFIAILWAFIAAIMVWYFSLNPHMTAFKIFIIVVFSVVGILGSYSVAWFGIRINTYANSRTAFAGLKGLPFPTMAIQIGRASCRERV